MKLVVPGGLPAEPLRRFLQAHALPGAEVHADGMHERVFWTADGPLTARIDLGQGPRCDVVEFDGPRELVPVVRRWLDLDGEHEAAERHLALDPRLAPLVAARPGLRFPRAVRGSETAILTVVGQQVSLAAARTFGGRLVAAFGARAGTLTAFPDPEVLAAAGPEALQAATGLTGARSRTVHTLSVAIADGLDLNTGDSGDMATWPQTRAALLSLPGIGPWTADYIGLRVFGDSDAFLPSDLVLRRALGGVAAREAAARAQVWSPWRGYALLHLWTEEAFG